MPKTSCKVVTSSGYVNLISSQEVIFRGGRPDGGPHGMNSGMWTGEAVTFDLRGCGGVPNSHSLFTYEERYQIRDSVVLGRLDGSARVLFAAKMLLARQELKYIASLAEGVARIASELEDSGEELVFTDGRARVQAKRSNAAIRRPSMYEMSVSFVTRNFVQISSPAIWGRAYHDHNTRNHSLKSVLETILSETHFRSEDHLRRSALASIRARNVDADYIDNFMEEINEF